MKKVKDRRNKKESNVWENVKKKKTDIEIKELNVWKDNKEKINKKKK